MMIKRFMKNHNSNSNDLSHHILPNSATMVGVCIMVISIVKSMGPGLTNHLIDKALAIDSLLFMISALLSFSSIRLERPAVSLERWAEMIFLLGLVSMTLITVIFSFEIA
ncbi:MAG: hypothetical protein PHD43_15920 [Methylococcales bacterium]|nr:hypothetical protein [Methylococcales bacterium]